ncbi:mechanosensitive ion channel family protein [Lentisphaera profundi]|uniref:Mechanosensitive ion channel family protein n=1 Tax=Lentisphaera profundi TaxID=1658616 RepID=A0ABY7VTA3_9BACT|nr:mechanosensitive ion channel family protein [Lentisphaera profundi]WDE96102.1 mechanosensitive ion channel family protein [Lentisphaera profundi]
MNLNLIIAQTELATSFWQKTYYNNTISLWLTSLGFVLGSVIIGKAIYWLFSKLVKALTNKTKNTLDDLVVDLVEEPIVAAFIASGIYFSLSLLTLPPMLERIIAKSYTMVVTLLVAWLITRFFEAFYQNILQPWADKTDNDLDDQLLPVIRKGIRSIIWIVALIIGLNNAGYDVGAMIAGLGIGGFALAMAAKDTVANVFGGFTIFTDKPFKMGDRIEIGGVDGTVVEIGIRSTRIKTLAGRIVTMPNNTFSDSPVENISIEPSRKIVLNLGLTYDTKPEQIEEAIAVLKEIVAENKSTEEDVITSFNGFGDFALNIMFIYYITKDEDIANTQTDMNLEILKRFNEKKLDFAFPTQTLHNINA